MDPTTDPNRRPPQQDSPESWFDSSPGFLSSPASAVYHRPGYQRIPSLGENGLQDNATRPSRYRSGSGDESMSKQGLAIAHIEMGKRRNSMPRVPVGSKSSPSSPSGQTSPEDPSRLQQRESKGSLRSEQGYFPYSHSETSSLHEPFASELDTDYLRPGRTPTITFSSHDTPGSQTTTHCPSKRDIYQGRKNWLAISILVLAIYSTIFSGIWVILAVWKPRYGTRITTYGQFPPGTASLLVAAFAKSIELSFVTVFVAFLGQVLSRRAFRKRSKGITIAEMSMRQWIQQPGTMITHWETVRYAGLSFLGMISLTAALLAIFYTTASDALVSPKLKFGKAEDKTLFGNVVASYANNTYQQSQCQTPISTEYDEVYAGPTCLAIEHSGQSFHNYIQYLSNWTDIIASNNGSTDLAQRPPPVGILYDNTTVRGSWINVGNMTEDSLIYNRTVNNISMAMPHSGVSAAARDPINSILQPEDLSGLGEYYIRASVPSPAINVLCAGVTEDEISPLVYSSWPAAASNPYNTSIPWPHNYSIPVFPSYINATPVDDLFMWGEKYDRRPPVFPKFPIAYNTILNSTGYFADNNTDTIYILAASPTLDYMLCSMTGSLSPNCSTDYHASGSGGSLISHCDDPNDPFAYAKSSPDATSGVINKNWYDVAEGWASAISLNAGASDDDASIDRILTQLIPTTWSLNASLPSIAEALAVLAGCTLLISGIDAPFIHYWNYTEAQPLNPPQYQGFRASLQFQDYASGGVATWQDIFYIILFLVFFTNIFCLVYLIAKGGLVTDFCEPANSFSLALNSPFSQKMAGSCGGGPEKEQFQASWYVNVENDHVFIDNGQGLHFPRRSTTSGSYSHVDLEMSPISRSYSKLSRKHTSFL